MATYNSTESSWSENPESITIGDHETLTLRFKYYSPGDDIQIAIFNSGIIKMPTLTTKKVGNDYWATVTIVGNKQGGGNEELTVYTYSAPNVPSLKATKIKVVKALVAHKIKFFDTNNEPLANNKLIAPKHIYKIKQSDNVASKGTQCSTLNKCLKTTDSSAYVNFTYSKSSSKFDISEYSWVTLSDEFNLPQTGSIQALKIGNICLKGIINDPSRNITKDMLQVSGDLVKGYTYWYIDGSLTPIV